TPSVAAVLRRHLALNRVSDRVHVLPVAVGSRTGQVELHDHSEPYRNSVGAADPMGHQTGTLPVPMTTIDVACRERGISPTLIRMDVQGLEYEVLQGARDLIRDGRGKLRLVLEVHPQLWHLHGLDREKFTALLIELGLRARPLIEGQPLYCPDAHVIL